MFSKINYQEDLNIQKTNSHENNLGTGYGLSISQKLCKLLMSKLYVKKNINGGCIFYFDIPHTNVEKIVTNIEAIINNDIIDLDFDKLNKNKNDLSQSEIVLLPKLIYIDEDGNEINIESMNPYRIIKNKDSSNKINLNINTENSVELELIEQNDSLTSENHLNVDN